MDRDRLILGLAAVFAGLTTLLLVLAFAYQLFLLVVAVPFGVVTYLLWSHATGRLEARMRGSARTGRRRPNDASRGPNDFRGFGPGRRAAGVGGAGEGRRRTTMSPGRRNEPSRAEAYRTLGVDPGASDEEVKRAYRARVKEVHPDTKSGDEESFKRVTRAYERLSD